MNTTDKMLLIIAKLFWYKDSMSTDNQVDYLRLLKKLTNLIDNE